MSDHPIRRADVIADIEQRTVEMLRENGGAGRIVVEFDFNRSLPVSYVVSKSGARRHLARAERT